MALIGARVPLPDMPLVHRAFEAHARRDPERTALTCGDEHLTFAQLDARANQVAHHLITRGTRPGSIVGVCLDRTPDLMVAILGILKAGAAYVPLDPGYPRERLEVMLAQLDGVRLTMGSRRTRELLAQAHGEVLVVEDLAAGLDAHPTDAPVVDVTPDDLCYVVFTSGSTGVPKATAVRHEGWYNLLAWLRDAYGLDQESSGLSVSSFGFDISQRGLMAPLFTGAAIHLLPSRTFDPALAHRLIARYGVRTLHCAPSTLYVLIDQERARGSDTLTGLSHVFIGGEPINVARVEEWATQDGNTCTLLHQYGVAECTDVATSYALTDYTRYRSGAVPVGTPVYNTEIRILDDDDRELPLGQAGEICISGTSVSAGYLNPAPADARRFTTVDRDGQALRIYRTGDRGFLTPEGQLVVVGRLDAQVKIRGMRIDPGDVEHAVRGFPGVTDSVVLALPGTSGEAELVAFLLLDELRANEIDALSVRRQLIRVLPRNMVPQQVVIVDSFPLTPNGKTDTKALARWGTP
ncbi:amino acid adenylation domain-containing protein [Streptomyces rubiginosohelvolus]|uniref:amino acid adenylation domain-containing protein n=1 Tax=Streptomyces rubiginosohelvolus TaxID=67362 RepID=UPI0036D99342